MPHPYLYQKIRIRNNGAGGDAATVAGYVGPGFHNWPSGHIPQDTDPNPLLRSRSHAKKTFGEAFGAATGGSDPRLRSVAQHHFPWAADTKRLRREVYFPTRAK
jgi:hypothetical protein